MDDMRRPIIEYVSARAALAGNPSDGYGGAVFAVPVPAYRATARLDLIAHGYELVDAQSGHAHFGHWADVERSLAAVDSTSRHGLLLGAIAEISGRSGRLPPCRLTIETTIPMSVGLAGSSAIVIAALRALMRPVDDAMTADELAVRALAVETDRLGIDAGLQDRVVQVYAQPMLMQFDADSTRGRPGVFTPIRPDRQLRLLVATLTSTSEASHIMHGDLRTRFNTRDQTVTDAMPELAGHAGDAAAAFKAADVRRLGTAMDATFDCRSSMVDLAPGHVGMIEAARRAGAHANYTGSGGSVVVLAPTEEIEAAARQSLNKLGCSIAAITSVSPGEPGED